MDIYEDLLFIPQLLGR